MSCGSIVSFFGSAFTFARRVFVSGQNVSSNATDTTIIVGAGVIGLSTAYQLALKQKTLKKPFKIIVVDVHESVFAEASSANSGCLIPNDMGDELQDLAKYSYESYLALTTEESFQNRTGFRQRALFSVDKGCGHNQDVLPSWLKAESEWSAHLEPRSGNSSLINPLALGDWLRSRCQALGVTIETSTELRSVEMSAQQTLDAVVYHKKKEGDVRLVASKLVLAAGPWTASVFARLFPSSRVDLQFTPIAGDYIVFRSPENISADSLSAVFMDHIVGHKLEFSARNDNTIWVCAQVNPSAPLPCVGSHQSPDPEMINELLGYTERFIDFSSQNESGEKHHRVDVVKQGRGFRPTTKSALPIIAGVPCSKLHHDLDSGDSYDKPSGIFICSGHGSYGVALGMGSAKLVVGQRPDIDISKFHLRHEIKIGGQRP